MNDFVKDDDQGKYRILELILDPYYSSLGRKDYILYFKLINLLYTNEEGKLIVTSLPGSEEELAFMTGWKGSLGDFKGHLYNLQKVRIVKKNSNGAFEIDPYFVTDEEGRLCFYAKI